MQASTQAVRALPPGHGNTIYAYCNVRTNQVLYSLERTLRQSHLSQLADVGANNNPPKLRKDMWRPLFTVSLPDPRQGLEVFRSLREYRMLHETNWELAEAIKKPYTEKQIEERKKKLDDRGGSKKETVFDVIKREKKKMRAQMVMDQKANSVADLAAILLRQGRRGSMLRKLKRSTEWGRKSTIKEIVALAEAHENGGTVGLYQKLKKLKVKYGEALQRSLDKSAPGKERRDGERKARIALQALNKAKFRTRRILYAVEAVKEAKETAAARARAPQRAPQTEEQMESAYIRYIKPYPAELDPVRAAEEGQAFSKRSPVLKKYQDHLKIVRAQVFRTEDIAIKWANSLDAEYAKLWPGNVRHENMGFVRNTAPAPDRPVAEQTSASQDSDSRARQRNTRSVKGNSAQRDQQRKGVEAVEPLVGRAATAEAEAAETVQQQKRTAVLADIKKQVLADVQLKAGKPFWQWSKELAKRAEKEQRGSATTETSAEPRAYHPL